MVVITLPCLLRGGTEFQTLQLVKAISNLKIEIVILVFFEVESEMLVLFEREGVEVSCLKFKRSLPVRQFVTKLIGVFRNLRPKVVHVQYMAPGALAIIAAKLAGVKIIIATVHQPHTIAHGLISKLLLRISSKFCFKFICVSMNVERSWFGSASLFDESIPLNKQCKHFTVYNSVDVSEILRIQSNISVEEKKKQLNIENEKILVGSVSRLREEKGIDLLIEAFAMSLKENRNLHLLIVGAGPQRTDLENFMQNLQIEEHCTFVGDANWIEAMEFMSCMDIVVVPSRFEGFGLSAAEAMALGKPVIASNVGGLAEVVTDKETGYLFQANDTSDLADHIIEMSESFSKREEMGKNGLKKVLEMFDIKQASERNILLYNQLLKLS